MQSYLKRILSARVYDVAIESPLEAAPSLSARIANNVLLKREDMQPVFSFKLRGAYNKMAQLTPAQLKRGVITASAGNHAQGVALAAQKLGCKAVIVVPTTTPQIKLQAIASRGAKVVLHGDSYSDAYRHALELGQKHKLTFVHPYDDPDVIAGQGTIGMEILRQHNQAIHAIFVPIVGVTTAASPAFTSNNKITTPIEILSPTLTLTSFTTPSNGAGTSIVALSVSKVSSDCSALTVSPTLTNTSITGTSL